MRIIVVLTLACLAAAPALAQRQRQPPERPIDHGPFTPEANRAYLGGGVILEGAPGAPLPPPSAVLNVSPGGAPTSSATNPALVVRP